MKASGGWGANDESPVQRWSESLLNQGKPQVYLVFDTRNLASTSSPGEVLALRGSFLLCGEIFGSLLDSILNGQDMVNGIFQHHG